MPIDFEQFIHPLDRKALHTLQKIPLLDTVLRKYMKMVDENLLRGVNMATMIRLGRNQLPRIHEMLLEICAYLDIPEPEFYLQMDPQPNAYTFGESKPFIVINSGLIDLLQKDELKSVIAHECGHILCHHVLYHTLAHYLMVAGGGLFGLQDLAMAPLRWSLFYWVRRSEFSADRVSAYVMEDSDVVVTAMMRLAGGKSEITNEVNIEEFLNQADEYQKNLDESKFSKLLQAIAIKDATHPFTVLRAREVRSWFGATQTQLPPTTEYGKLFQEVKLK